MFQIVTEAPAWFFLFCISAGALFCLVLYRKKNSQNEIKPWLRWLLMSFRFVSVTLISFLLLSPLIRTLSRETEKPIIIIAQDNSESVISSKDSSYYREEYPSKVKALIQSLGEKYEVKTVSFSDKLEESIDFSFTGKQTDISNLLDETDIRFANRNVGAIILASDGLYNKGTNPVYHSGAVNVPVYTIALGDTTEKKDLLVGNIRYNKVVFLNNSFPVEVTVEGRQSGGATTTLTFAEDSSVLFTRQVAITGNKFRQVIPFYPEAKKKGIHHYRITLSGIDGEVTKSNNEKDIYVDVQESRRKVLIVADSPHPDVAALLQSIESNENYDVKATTIDKFDGVLKDEQLVILHQLPSTDHPAADLVRLIQQKSISSLYILGAQSNINAFNALSAGVTISNWLNRGNMVQPSVNENFSLFTVDQQAAVRVKTFPPLLTPFGEYRVSAGGTSLLNQLIGSVLTSQPLLYLGENAEMRTGVVCGEGLWRWRLNDYQVNGSFAAFDEMISKSVQYLTTREVKSHFKINAKTSFFENEPVILNAEVYNDNFELVNTPDVSITITSKSDNRSFPYNFSKTEKAYVLNAGIFAPGEYHYKSTVRAGDKVYNAEGRFTVSALQVERYETVADHQLLFALSNKTGGKLFYPSQLDELSKVLESRTDLKTVSYSHLKLIDLVNLKSLFLVLLLLLSVEWFLRKRNGGY